MKFKFIDTAKRTQTGFYHRSELYCDGELITFARVTYYNRTWESYTFQTSRKCAVEKAMKQRKDILPELQKLYDSL